MSSIDFYSSLSEPIPAKKVRVLFAYVAMA